MEKLCWFCQHFSYINSSPDYSELTPGNAFDISCSRSKWTFDSDRTTQARFGEILATAATCDSFVPVESLKAKFQG